MSGSMADKVPMIPYKDYIGDEYPCTEKILVKIFSQCYSSDDKRGKEMVEKVDIDAIYLKKLFYDIHYTKPTEVDIMNQRRKDEVIKEIKDLGNSQEYDAFFFVFLTYLEYGNSGSKGYRDERIHLHDGPCPLQDIFDEVKKVESMRMKPKIFLIQADDLSLLHEYLYTKGEELPVIVKIPQDADRLVIMSDIPQKLANIEKPEQKASFLIEAFCETLRENSQAGPENRQDLLTLTTTINKKVDAKIKSIAPYKIPDTKQDRTKDLKVPLVTSTLTKLVKI